MKKLSLAILISASFVSVNAFAKSSYVGEVPNGAHNDCQTCHVNVRSPWNVFGEELRNDQDKYYKTVGNSEQPDWSTFCEEDFDNDGFSNGVELGDPDCEFPGVAAGAYVSDPADENLKPADDNNGTNNATNNGTTSGSNNGTTTGSNNGTTAGGNNGTTAGGNNGTTAGNNGTTTGGNNGTGGNNTTGETTGGEDLDEGCSSTGSNPGQFSLVALLGLFFFARKRRK